MTIQKRLARSKAMKRAIRELYTNGTPGNRREANALFYEITEEIIACYSDNQCRDLCRFFLQAEDLTAAERQQLKEILM